MTEEMKKDLDEAIAHFDYGLKHDIFSEPVTKYATMAVSALMLIRDINRGEVIKEPWISVNDGLPESGQHVLCVLKSGGFDICQWCSFDKSWSNDHDWCQEKEVTHWIPLPDVPKGE